MHNAVSSYHLALSKANNEPTEATRAAATDYKTAVNEGKNLLVERRDLCEDLGDYSPAINPANFLTPAQIAATSTLLFRLIPGTTMNYRSTTPAGTAARIPTAHLRPRRVSGPSLRLGSQSLPRLRSG